MHTKLFLTSRIVIVLCLFILSGGCTPTDSHLFTYITSGPGSVRASRRSACLPVPRDVQLYSSLQVLLPQFFMEFPVGLSFCLNIVYGTLKTEYHKPFVTLSCTTIFAGPRFTCTLTCHSPAPWCCRAGPLSKDPTLLSLACSPQTWLSPSQAHITSQ